MKEDEEEEEDGEGEVETKASSGETTSGASIIPDSQSQDQIEEEEESGRSGTLAVNKVLSATSIVKPALPTVRFVDPLSTDDTNGDDDEADDASNSSSLPPPPTTSKLPPSSMRRPPSPGFQSSFPPSRPLGSVPVPTRAAFLAQEDASSGDLLSSQVDSIEDPDSSPRRPTDAVPSSSRLPLPMPTVPSAATASSSRLSPAPLSRHSSKVSTTSDQPSSQSNRKRKPQLVLVLQDDPTASGSPLSNSGSTSPTSSSPATFSGEMSLFSFDEDPQNHTSSQLVPVILRTRNPEDGSTSGPFTIHSGNNLGPQRRVGGGASARPVVKTPVVRPVIRSVASEMDGDGTATVATMGYEQEIEDGLGGGGGSYEDDQVMFGDYVDFDALVGCESNALPTLGRTSSGAGSGGEPKDSGEGAVGNGNTGSGNDGSGPNSNVNGATNPSNTGAGNLPATSTTGSAAPAPAQGGRPPSDLPGPFLTAWTPQHSSQNWFTNDPPNGRPGTAGGTGGGGSTSGTSMDSIAAYLLKKMMNPVPAPVAAVVATEVTAVTSSNGKRTLEGEGEDATIKKPRTLEPTPEPHTSLLPPASHASELLGPPATAPPPTNILSRSLANVVHPQRDRSTSPLAPSFTLTSPNLGPVRSVALSVAGSASSRNASPAPGGGTNLSELIRASPFIVDSDLTKDEIVRFVTSPSAYIGEYFSLLSFSPRGTRF